MIPFLVFFGVLLSLGIWCGTQIYQQKKQHEYWLAEKVTKCNFDARDEIDKAVAQYKEVILRHQDEMTEVKKRLNVLMVKNGFSV